MLKMSRNTELEDIYSEMIYELIKSKRDEVKVTKLHDFAIAVKNELDTIDIILEVEEMPEEDDEEQLEIWDKKYIKQFVCLPFEKLQEICLKKTKDSNVSDIEKKIKNMYSGFTQGIDVNKLSENWQKEKWKEYACEVNDETQKKVCLKPYQLITEMQKMSYCPYCNSREIESRGNKAGGELDHFFAKKEDATPLLALCLYNFIPSCSICNKAKRDVIHFQSPYDSKYDIDSIRFYTFFSPRNTKKDIKVKIEIAGKQYDSEELNSMSVKGEQKAILNNFIKMNILGDYKGGDQIQHMISDIMDKNAKYVESLAQISNTSVEKIFCRIYGDILNDDELIQNQKGKYKRDFLWQHDIVSNKNGKYIFNEEFGGVEEWK